MQELKDFLKVKKNLISLLAFGILALALPLGLDLLKKQQIFLSRATEARIDFTGPNIIRKPSGDQAFKLNDQGQAVVTLELISPLGSPTPSIPSSIPSGSLTLTSIPKKGTVPIALSKGAFEFLQSIIPKGGFEVVKPVYAANDDPDVTWETCYPGSDFSKHPNGCQEYHETIGTCDVAGVDQDWHTECADPGQLCAQGGRVGKIVLVKSWTIHCGAVDSTEVGTYHAFECGRDVIENSCGRGGDPEKPDCNSNKQGSGTCNAPSDVQCGSGTNGTYSTCQYQSHTSGYACNAINTTGCNSCSYSLGNGSCSSNQTCSNNRCQTVATPNCTTGKTCTGCDTGSKQCGNATGTETGCTLTTHPNGTCNAVSTNGGSCTRDLGGCSGGQTCSNNQCGGTPVNASCSSFTFPSLSQDSQPNPGGGPIYRVPSAGTTTGVNVSYVPAFPTGVVDFAVTKNPASAPALDINQNPTGGSITRTAVIRPNTITSDNVYDITATVISTANSSIDLCHPVQIVVQSPSAPQAPSCAGFSPQGLSPTGVNDGQGRPEFAAPDGSARNSLLQVTRSPASSTISQPTIVTVSPTGAPTLSFGQAADGNRVAQIPANQSTTDDNRYTIEANVTSGSQSAQCFAFVLKVPKATVNTSCPSSINNTQVKFRGADGVWRSQNQHITTAESIRVAGFHNQVTPDPPPSDIELSVVGPEGFTTAVTQNSDFTPTAGAGDYQFTALTTGVSESEGRCKGQSTLHVDPPAPITLQVRIAESRQDLLTNPPDPNKVRVFDYTSEPFRIDSFPFSDPTPGLKTVFVEFVGSGNRREIRQKSIELVGTPQITSCRTELSANQVSFEINGQNFGQQKGAGELKINDSPATTLRWANNRVTATVQNPQPGQSFRIGVRNDGGLSTDEVACSTISSLAVSAKLFCRLPNQHDQENVSLTLVGTVGIGTSAGVGIGTTAGGRLTSATVKIAKDGTIQGLSANLIEGQNYKLALKAPKSLRRIFNFVAGSGTTILSNVSLPIGDIFPADGGDGKINANDGSDLLRQWRLSSATAGRSGDFNQDGFVNSFDWACMRRNFGTSDDSEPTAAGP